MKKYTLAVFLFLFLRSVSDFSQEPFTVSVVPIQFNNFPGLHSFAFAQQNGLWVFIGGRTNGLHHFEPPFAFMTNAINNNIYVVNPLTQQIWSAPATSLPVDTKEAITSTNMEFVQRDSILYMIGGYGWSSALSDFKTFPTLTAINLNSLTNAVISSSSINNSFRQIIDTTMAITGGNGMMIDSTVYLVFGHKFDGRYNRVDSLITTIQKYSNQVRAFNIWDDGTNLTIANYQATTDTVNFHRRDFNLVPQIFPDRASGATAFSGVFQYNIDLPYLNSVDLKPGNYAVNNNFNQNLSQYSSAVMPVYDSTHNYMHSVFFGGISMYYPDTITQIMTTDSLVPFVNTISKVTRAPDSTMTEYALPIRMPAFLGANSLFIPDTSIAHYSGEVINLNHLSGLTRVGWIVGGILSPDRNIADNDPGVSIASTEVFEVYIDKNVTSNQGVMMKNNIMNFIAYPNPGNQINIQFETDKDAIIEIIDIHGRTVEGSVVKKDTGIRTLLRYTTSTLTPGIYFCRVKIGDESKTMKLMIAGNH